jgi:two-component system response regulator HydG
MQRSAQARPKPAGDAMANPSPWITVVRLSDSFWTTVREMTGELGATALEWEPNGNEAPPSGGAAMLILAGGMEAEALELLDRLGQTDGGPFVVGATEDHRLASGFLRKGARDYFAMPADLDLLRRSLERELRSAKGRVEAERYASDERRTRGFESIIGRSKAVRQVIDQAARVAVHGEVTVLIGGETGTGKELLAQAIHYHSPRAAAPFVPVNCAAIPANLLESELFGHERGAFTGAVAAKQGLFEAAHGGTLFLDEIGHMPLELQTKLLRALESGEVRRVGGQASRQVNVRVLAATHVNLTKAIAAGAFREDLYYRLNVVALQLPALRDRDGDIERLAGAFLSQLATRYGVPVPPLTPEVRQRLAEHPWPGNVRELRNAMERALVLSPPGTLSIDELRLEGDAGGAPSVGPLPFPADLETITRAAARAMLEITDNNKSEAARRLGISRPRLNRLLENDS